MEQIDLTDAACLTVPFKSKYQRLQMSSRIRVNAKQPIPKPNGKTMKSDTDLSSFDVVTMFFHSFCPPQKEIMLFHCTTSHQMKVKWNTLISHRLCGHAMTDIHAMWKESSSIIYNPSSSIIITIIIIIIFIIIMLTIIIVLHLHHHHHHHHHHHLHPHHHHRVGSAGVAVGSFRLGFL
jgi:hypothetical protein